MASADPNIALSEKRIGILSNVHTYRELSNVFFYRVFLTLLVLELEWSCNISPPTHTHAMAKLAETATGARVSKTSYLRHL